MLLLLSLSLFYTGLQGISDFYDISIYLPISLPIYLPAQCGFHALLFLDW